MVARKTIATYDATTVSVDYDHPSVSNRKDKSYTAGYDKNARTFRITQNSSFHIAGVSFWASFGDDSDENSSSTDDDGYTYYYGFDSNGQPVYLRIVKDAVGSDPYDEFTINPTTGTVTQTRSAIGDSFRITYDPSSKLVNVERFNSSTNISFINEVITYADGSTATAAYQYVDTSGYDDTYKFDADGHLIWFEIDDYGAGAVWRTKYQAKIKWQEQNGVLVPVVSSNDVYNDRGFTFTSNYPSGNIDSGLWSFEINGTNVNIKSHRSGHAADSSTNNSFASFTTTPSASVYFDLSEYPASYTFPTTFIHDFTTTLPMPDISHSVEITHAPDYTHVLPTPEPTEERFLSLPDAEHTHNLAKVLGLHEYTVAKQAAYYSYVVVEKEVPKDYELIYWYARSDTSTAIFYNRFVESLIKIIIDKFQSGDRSQKLGGAEFLLYRYPTQEELDEHSEWNAETVLYYMLDQSGTPGFTPERENATPQTTDSNGYAEFDELDDGVYYVVETKAPIDYRTRSDVMKLVVGTVENETSAVADDIILTNPAERVMAAHVPNYPDSTLPATGGEGAAWMQGAAIALLTLGGAYLLYNALRKRREEDPDRPAA